MPIEKEILNVLNLGRKPFQLEFFILKLANIAKDKCFHCVMALDYSFRLLSTPQLQGIIALWVHPSKAEIHSAMRRKLSLK